MYDGFALQEKSFFRRWDSPSPLNQIGTLTFASFVKTALYGVSSNFLKNNRFSRSFSSTLLQFVCTQLYKVYIFVFDSSSAGNW